MPQYIIFLIIVVVIIVGLIWIKKGTENLLYSNLEVAYLIYYCSF